MALIKENYVQPTIPAPYPTNGNTNFYIVLKRHLKCVTSNAMIVKHTFFLHFHDMNELDISYSLKVIYFKKFNLVQY